MQGDEGRRVNDTVKKEAINYPESTDQKAHLISEKIYKKKRYVEEDEKDQ